MEEVVERSFVMIKPDAVKRKLVGKIISRLEKKDLRLVCMKSTQLSLQQAQNLYDDIRDKPYFENNCKFVSSGISIIMVWEGKDCIKIIRNLVGSFDNPGSIRGSFGTINPENCIHASDSNAAYEREYFAAFDSMSPHISHQRDNILDVSEDTFKRRKLDSF